MLLWCTSRLVWYCSSISRASYKRDKFSMNPDFMLQLLSTCLTALHCKISLGILIFEVLLMLSQHLLHNSLICIISDKGIHNDSHYTDVTGEFRFLSAPPLLRDSSSHDDYNDYMMMMLTCTVTSESQAGTRRGIYSIDNFLSKICLKERLWISEWYFDVLGLYEFSICWDVPMTLSPRTREPWRNDTYETPHFVEIIISALAEIRSNVCRSPHFFT